MVITILEARVTLENMSVLEAAFKNAVKQLDPGLVETSLIRDFKDQASWKIISLWESRQALETMRQSGETPRGVLIFREAKAEPVLSVFDVVVHGAE
jgi:heme-degrading monooxygenase HmoA